MKSLITLLLSFLFSFLYCQTPPIVYFATANQVSGEGIKGDTIKISIDGDSVPEYDIIVDDKGKFNFSFPSAIESSAIVLWSVNTSNDISPKLFVEIGKADNVLKDYNTMNFNLSINSGNTVRYKATIWNTNFSVPLARFNFVKGDENKKGNLLLFNSIGAGFGISLGELSETRDINGYLIDQDFVNTFGIHIGFLFSAAISDDSKNVFAPTLNISVLDFQLGVGYELGNLETNQRPFFLTLSYAIPLYKLKKGSFWIWKGSKPITDFTESRMGD